MGGARVAELVFLVLEKVELAVKYIILLGCLTLFCVQLVLTRTSAREYLSFVDRLEGSRVPGEEMLYATAPVEITEQAVMTRPGAEQSGESRLLAISPVEPVAQGKAIVRINGDKAHVFGLGDLVFGVRDGDVVEIDGSQLQQVVHFRVSIPHNDVEYPTHGFITETKGNKVMLGEVRFKH